MYMGVLKTRDTHIINQNVRHNGKILTFALEIVLLKKYRYIIQLIFYFLSVP